MKLWCTWEVSRALKKLEFILWLGYHLKQILHFSCALQTSYVHITWWSMLTHEPIVRCSKPYLIYFQDMLSKNDTKMTSVSAAYLRSKHFIATTTESCNTHDVTTTTVPVAMRSSFAVGVRIKFPSIHTSNYPVWLSVFDSQMYLMMVLYFLFLGSRSCKVWKLPV